MSTLIKNGRIVTAEQDYIEITQGRIMHWMRNFILVFILLSLATGCRQATEPTTQNALLSIDLQEEFASDHVQIAVDQQIVFNDTVTTNFSLGLAGWYSKRVSVGSHRIEVSIPDREVQRDTTVNLRDTLTVAVTYDRAGNILSFSLFNFLILYR